MFGDSRIITELGEEPPGPFVDQVKHALEHLYDFASLQHHPLLHQLEIDVSTQSPRIIAQDLRRELINAIDILNPGANIVFSDPRARLYNLLLLHYVEGMTIQETANELGISGRQAYRNLRDGNASVATVLWEKRRVMPSPEQRAIHLSSVETGNDPA